MLCQARYDHDMAITLKDENEKSAAAIRQKLSLYGFDKQSEDIVLHIGDAQDNTARFIRPVRIGNILDHARSLQKTAIRNKTPKTIPIGSCSLHVQTGCLCDKNGLEIVRLTDKEIQILVFLTNQDGQETERDTLLKAVWDYADNVETHTLETHIYRLRQKIESDPSHPEILVTTEKGYVLRHDG